MWILRKSTGIDIPEIGNGLYPESIKNESTKAVQYLFLNSTILYLLRNTEY